MEFQSEKLTGYPSIDKPWLKYYDCNNIQPNLKLNLVDYIKQKNFGRENRTANIYYGKRTTYKEMYNQIDNASKALKQIGAVSDFADPRPDSTNIFANAKKY